MAAGDYFVGAAFQQMTAQQADLRRPNLDVVFNILDRAGYAAWCDLERDVIGLRLMVPGSYDAVPTYYVDKRRFFQLCPASADPHQAAAILVMLAGLTDRDAVMVQQLLGSDVDPTSTSHPLWAPGTSSVVRVEGNWLATGGSYTAIPASFGLKGTP